MTVLVSENPFTTGHRGQWVDDGPAWVEINGFGGDLAVTSDIPVCLGIQRFVKMAVTMAPADMKYGTVYAAILDDAAVTAGEWHYDLGERTERGSQRYVGTWTSDNYPIQNVFQLENGQTLQPPNNHVVSFHEGLDFHCRAFVPERPGQWGAFVSLALYRGDEPANLNCPRLAALRTRGARSIQALEHPKVARIRY